MGWLKTFRNQTYKKTIETYKQRGKLNIYDPGLHCPKNIKNIGSKNKARGRKAKTRPDLTNESPNVSQASIFPAPEQTLNLQYSAKKSRNTKNAKSSSQNKKRKKKILSF